MRFLLLVALVALGASLSADAASLHMLSGNVYGSSNGGSPSVSTDNGEPRYTTLPVTFNPTPVRDNYYSYAPVQPVFAPAPQPQQYTYYVSSPPVVNAAPIATPYSSYEMPPAPVVTAPVTQQQVYYYPVQVQAPQPTYYQVQAPPAQQYYYPAPVQQQPQGPSIYQSPADENTEIFMRNRNRNLNVVGESAKNSYSNAPVFSPSGPVVNPIVTGPIVTGPSYNPYPITNPIVTGPVSPVYPGSYYPQYAAATTFPVTNTQYYTQPRVEDVRETESTDYATTTISPIVAETTTAKAYYTYPAIVVAETTTTTTTTEAPRTYSPPVVSAPSQDRYRPQVETSPSQQDRYRPSVQVVEPIVVRGGDRYEQQPRVESRPSSSSSSYQPRVESGDRYAPRVESSRGSSYYSDPRTTVRDSRPPSYQSPLSLVIRHNNNN